MVRTVFYGMVSVRTKNDSYVKLIYYFFDPPKWSKMEPFGALWGAPGAPWEGMASHSAPKRLQRVPKGLPWYPQDLNLDVF